MEVEHIITVLNITVADETEGLSDIVIDVTWKIDSVDKETGIEKSSCHITRLLNVEKTNYIKIKDLYDELLIRWVSFALRTQQQKEFASRGEKIPKEQNRDPFFVYKQEQEKRLLKKKEKQEKIVNIKNIPWKTSK